MRIYSAHFLKTKSSIKVYLFSIFFEKISKFWTYLKYILMPYHPKSDIWIFFLALVVKRSFCIKYFEQQDIRAMGLIPEKNRSFIGIGFPEKVDFTNILLEAAIGKCSATFRGCFRFSEIIIYLPTSDF